MTSENLIKESNKSFTEVLSEKSEINEKDITNKFYHQYKQIRIQLIQGLKENNVGLNIEDLVRLAQKLLDRIIFIRFCEDMRLLPEEFRLGEIVQAAKESYQNVWDVLKNLFRLLDEGCNEKNINKFNGGLFKFDKELDNLNIPESLFHSLFYFISEYDFSSDINVNILGHIFEQSITDLEELKAGLGDRMVGKKPAKKKRNGIYYTPKFITKYIVENSLGKYLEEKLTEARAEAEKIMEKSNNKRKLPKNKIELKTLEIYRDKLYKIKILDPACGSGAFLVEVFDYLIDVYTETQKRIEELSKRANQISIFDLNKQILNNNIYGVDLNEESVEITKLSLWLKTAEKDKPLTYLDNQIKCGNSLISDKRYLGNKAFDWEKEFPEVFEAGGFDVVVGNPPYVNSKLISQEERQYYWDNYKEILKNDLDLYQIFMYLGFDKLLKQDGYLGYITPNSYFVNMSFELLRDKILSNTTIVNIVDFPYRYFPFEDVNTETAITIIKKAETKSHWSKVNKIIKNEIMNLPIRLHNPRDIRLPMMRNDNRFFINISDLSLNILDRTKSINFDKIFKVSNPSSLDRANRYPRTSSKKYNKCIFTKDELELDPELKEICVPCIEGDNIAKYHIHGEEKYTNKAWQESSTIKEINHRTMQLMNQEKLVGQRITGQAKERIVFSYDENNHITMPSVNIINVIDSGGMYDKKTLLLFLLGTLNSTLFNHLYKDIFGEANTNITSDVFTTIPIPQYRKSFLEEFGKVVNEKLETKRKIYSQTNNFTSYMNKAHNIDKNIGPLKNFYKLDFHTFLDELDKRKIKLTEQVKFELMHIFEQEKKNIFKMEEKASNLRKEIDSLVYKLYGLSSEEIGEIEKSK
ncbi:MAG: methylase [Anaerosolibacter sp.]|nr:methylase [Anaerosolibacter sp.]